MIHVSLPTNIVVCTPQASDSLPFILNERPLVASRGTRSLNFAQAIHILTATLLEQLPQQQIWSPGYWKLSTTSSFYPRHLMESVFCISSVFIVPMYLPHTKCIFQVNLSFILLHLLCVHGLHWVHCTEFLPMLFRSSG